MIEENRVVSDLCYSRLSRGKGPSGGVVLGWFGKDGEDIYVQEQRGRYTNTKKDGG